MKISILHPSRSRPELAKKVYDEWMGKAANPDEIEYILSLDFSDYTTSDYITLFMGNTARVLTPDWQPIIYRYNLFISRDHNKSAIEAINNAAKIATGDLLIVVSDDFSCPQNWDVDLLKNIGDKKDFAAKTQDGIQPWMMTMPIMDRVYYERYGFIYHPAYKHMYADLELSCVADLTGKKIDIPMLFKHNHYSQKGGIKKDEVTTKNDSTYPQGEKTFIERWHKNFDIPADEIAGTINPDANCYKWFKNKGLL